MLGFDSDVERFIDHKFPYHSVGDDKLIRKRMETGTADEKASFFEDLIGEIGSAIEREAPDLIFIDPMSHISVVAALRAGVEARYLWVFNPPIKGDGHFPFCKVRRWREYLILRKFPAVQWFVFWLVYQYQIIRRGIRRKTVFDLKVRPAAEAHGLGWQFTYLGYMIDLPSVVLGPQALADSASGKVTHLGLGVEPRESEAEYEIRDDKKIIFVSFGSNFDLYEAADRVTNVLLSAARNMEELNFIFHVPAAFERPVDRPVNVVFATQVPVFKILEKAAVVVTHGGYGGIKESIFFKVPMLVVPFDFDQPGNAYHIEKNGVGLVLSPREITKENARNSLEQLIENSQFRSQITELGSRMRQADISVRYVDDLKAHIEARRDA